MASIAETCPDVKDNFTGVAIADSIAAVQATLDTLNAAIALTAESTIEAEKTTINAAIEALVADAKAAQAVVDADKAKKAANDAAYAKLTAEVAALTESLNAAVASIAETCPDVKNNFTGVAIADSIAVVQATLDSLNAAIALTAESTIEAEKTTISAAIEALVADAKVAQAAVEADRAKKAANDAAYAKLTAEVNGLSSSLNATLAVISGFCPDVKDSFTGAEIADSITAVQVKLDSLNAAIALTAESNIDAEKAAINAAIETLIADAQAAQAALPLEPGTYYLRNVESKAFLVGGNSWGTQATAGKVGIDWDVTIVAGKYVLDSKIANGATQHYLGTNGFVDSDATGYTLVENEDGSFTIMTADGLVLTAPAADAETTVVEFKTDEASTLANWEFITKATLDEELAQATVDAPIDATYLIPGANFGRNDSRNNSWSFEASNKNISGGNNTNNNAESYHAVFSLTQTVNVPNGVYALTAQGFYRQDGTDFENLPYFFANEETMTMIEKDGAENSMSDASASFTAGLYTSQPIYVEVTDGTLYLGVKNDVNVSLWCIWDNFQLKYYGSETTVEAVKNAVAIKGTPVTSIIKRAAGIYTINGAKLNSVQKGLNIVVDEDGTVRKVFVK